MTARESASLSIGWSRTFEDLCRSGPRPSQGDVAGRHAAVAPLARGIDADRLDQVGAAEIRPEAGQEDELAVGGLPWQEVRHPDLAAGADDQVRIGNAFRVEIVGKDFLRDLVGAEQPGFHRPRHLARSPRYLVAAT